MSEPKVAELVGRERDLQLTCRGCGRTSSVKPLKVTRGRPGITLAQLGARAKCEACGHKGADVTVAPANG